MWDNCNDLDLHLVEADNGGVGTTIYYGRKSNAATGAQLDIDANGGGCRTDTPVENIAYKNVAGEEIIPPYGDYMVKVHYYSTHADKVKSVFNLVIKLGNKSFAFMN